jgi:GT2 family glycosyltransferase
MPGTGSRDAVVVVSYGDPTVLLDNPMLVASSRWHAVVVDNLSTPDHRASARALAQRHGWELLEPGSNLGFGAGANLGIERAVAGGSEVVLLVNPDAQLEHAAAEALATSVRSEPGLLASPTVVRPDGSPWFAGASLDLRTGRTSGDRDAYATPWLSGACLATRADAWLRHGGFADDYFLYWEDIDLSVRWVASGGRLAVLDTVTCRHAVGGTQHASSSRAKSPQYYYYNCRNRLLFAARNLPARARWRWACGALPYARDVLLRGGRRQLLHPRSTLGAAMRGTVAGLAQLVGGAPRKDERPPAATG